MKDFVLAVSIMFTVFFLIGMDTRDLQSQLDNLRQRIEAVEARVEALEAHAPPSI